MRTIGNLTAVAAATLCGLIIVACQKSDPDPNTAANANGQYPQQGYPQGYPQPGQPPQGGAYPAASGYPAPNGAPQAYPTGAPTAYPTAAPGAAPGAPPAAGGGQMATPNQFALACQNDQGCGLAHCNVPAGKCAFPCQNSAVDCIQGASCNTISGLCLPGGG